MSFESSPERPQKGGPEPEEALMGHAENIRQSAEDVSGAETKRNEILKIAELERQIMESQQEIARLSEEIRVLDEEERMLEARETESVNISQESPQREDYKGLLSLLDVDDLTISNKAKERMGALIKKGIFDNDVPRLLELTYHDDLTIERLAKDRVEEQIKNGVFDNDVPRLLELAYHDDLTIERLAKDRVERFVKEGKLDAAAYAKMIHDLAAAKAERKQQKREEFRESRYGGLSRSDVDKIYSEIDRSSPDDVIGHFDDSGSFVQRKAKNTFSKLAKSGALDDRLQEFLEHDHPHVRRAARNRANALERKQKRESKKTKEELEKTTEGAN